jgi:hypothetical protein
LPQTKNDCLTILPKINNQWLPNNLTDNKAQQN